MDELVDGWMDGWMDVLMAGWPDANTNASNVLQTQTRGVSACDTHTHVRGDVKDHLAAKRDPHNEKYTYTCSEIVVECHYNCKHVNICTFASSKINQQAKRNCTHNSIKLYLYCQICSRLLTLLSAKTLAQCVFQITARAECARALRA